MDKFSENKGTETYDIFALRANIAGTVVFFLAFIRDILGVCTSLPCLDILFGGVALVILFLLWIMCPAMLDVMNHCEKMRKLNEKKFFECVTAFSAILFGVEKVLNMNDLKEIYTEMQEPLHAGMFIIGLLMAILIIFKRRRKKGLT